MNFDEWYGLYGAHLDEMDYVSDSDIKEYQKDAFEAGFEITKVYMDEIKSLEAKNGELEIWKTKAKEKMPAMQMRIHELEAKNGELEKKLEDAQERIESESAFHKEAGRLPTFMVGHFLSINRRKL